MFTYSHPTIGLAPIVDACRVTATALDLPALDPSALVDRVAAAVTNAATDPRPMDRAIREMFDRLAATVAVAAEDDDTAADHVRRVIGHVGLALTFDTIDVRTRQTRDVDAGIGQAVRDVDGTVRDQITRGAAPTRRTRKGQTVRRSVSGPLDSAQRSAVSLANAATRETGIALLGTIRGHMPREVTPVIAGSLEVPRWVRDSRGVGKRTDGSVTVERGAEYVGASQSAAPNVRASRGQWQLSRHRVAEIEWTADPTRPNVLLATVEHRVSEQVDPSDRTYDPTDPRTWTVRRAYRVTGHGQRVEQTTAKRAKRVAAANAARTAKRAAAAEHRAAIGAILSGLASDGDATAVNGLSVIRRGVSRRGRPLYVIGRADTAVPAAAAVREILAAVTA